MFFFSAAVFFLGLAVGSFLNAVICRLRTHESALKGRSRCPRCGHLLAWRDLIPIASFMLLCGKCRYCKESISWQYPLVEIATALLFFLIFNFQFSIFNEFSNFLIFKLVYLWTVAGLLVVLFVYDLRHYILPDKVLLPAIGFTFFYQIFTWTLNHWILIENWSLKIENFAPLADPLLAGLGAAIFFFSIFALSRGRAMGFGDVKLAFFMGLFLGWPGIAVALFVSFMAGAAVGILLIASKKKKLKSEVPFGPFLIFGTAAAFFAGERIIHWYLSLMLI